MSSEYVWWWQLSKQLDCRSLASTSTVAAVLTAPFQYCSSQSNQAQPPRKTATTWASANEIPHSQWLTWDNARLVAHKSDN